MRKIYTCKSCGYTSNSTKNMHFEYEKCKEDDKKLIVHYICKKCVKEKE